MLEDVQWDQITKGRCLLVGDFNTHSPLWNPLVRARVNAGPLEDLIDKAGLYINDELGVSTQPKNTPGISIIDLALTTVSMGPLEAWTIGEEDCIQQKGGGGGAMRGPTQRINSKNASPKSEAARAKSDRKNSTNLVEVEAAMEGSFIEHAQRSGNGTLNLNGHLVIRRHPRVRSTYSEIQNTG